MLRMMDTEAGFTGPINLGNPGEFTMLELAEKVISLVGSKSKLTFMPLPQDDPKQRKPVIDLAEQARRLGAESAARRRPEGDDRLLPQSAGRVGRATPQAGWRPAPDTDGRSADLEPRGGARTSRI